MIAFENVRFRRGDQDILHDVSFSVQSGETLALVGRSGAGKSTVLKLINRMLEPHGGVVRRWRCNPESEAAPRRGTRPRHGGPSMILY